MSWKESAAARARGAYDRLRESPAATSLAVLTMLLIAALFVIAWKEAQIDALKRELALAQEQIAVYESTRMREGENPVEVKADAKSSADVAYVPKEYVTAPDGSRVREQTDAELSVTPPTVAVKYNGKEYDLPGITGETTKFERGKIQSEVSTHATLDLTPLIDTAAEQKARAQMKHFSFGAFATSEGAALGLGYENRNYGIDVLMNPVEPSKFWGVGFRRRF